MENRNTAAETVDHLLNTDVSGRGIIGLLYAHARECLGAPLAWSAAERLVAAAREPGKVILIATGASYQRVGINPNIGEMDGPPGAVALARAVGRGLRAVPVLVTERGQEDPLTQAARAVGLTRTDRAGSLEQANRSPYNTSVVVEGFPSEDTEAKGVAAALLDSYAPVAVVTIEKAGMNRVGVYHNSLGFDTSAGKARIDYLVRQAADRSIATIGIGDGGNEIGMGVIEDGVRAHVPYADVCQCKCGAGMASATKVDVLVTAAVSNWGAYGIIACLAMILGKEDVLHTAEQCERAIQGCAAAGYLDTGGYCDNAADGMPAKVHMALVELLATVVRSPYRQLQKIGYGGGSR